MKHRWPRLFLHLPVGLLNVLALALNPALGLAFCFAFLTYQTLEDWRMVDHSHIDLEGYLWGLALGIAVWAGWVWL